MARPSYTPLIETTLKTFPDLKDNYKKLAQKVGCCTKTIKRYFESLDSKVPLDNTKNKTISANPPLEQMFIDDPNELLFDTATKVISKQRYILLSEGKIPGNRWATILLNLLDKTKQLELKSKSEITSKLKQYSTSDLINLRKKLIGNLQDVG